MGAFPHRRPEREVRERQNSNGANLELPHKMRQFIRLWTVALVVVVLAALSLESMKGVAAYPNQPAYQNGMRINRRGFKSSLLSTARGFGKRSDPSIAEPASEDSMPSAYETIAYNPRLLSYLLKTEEEAAAAAGDESQVLHHR